MPIGFIIGIVLALICLVVAAAALAVRKKEGTRGAGALAALAIVAALFSAFLPATTSVPAQNIGVVTRFGKPVDALKPGLHVKAPWDKVTDMDGTIQQIDNAGDARTKVRLNSNATMFVDNALRWRIKQDAAAQLFADWRKFDRISEGLVAKELAASLNDTLSTYDPLTVGAKNMTNDEMATTVAQRLQQRLGDRVEVVSFSVIRVDFDEATQARINEFQGEVAKTRQAQQRKETATAEAAANEELNTSVEDPNVLVSKCLDTQRQAIERGQSLSGAPSCWPYEGVTKTLPVK